MRELTNAIINPSTLTAKQKERIRKEYAMAKVRVVYGGFPGYCDDIMLINDLEAKYGKDFFEKGE